IAAGHIGGGDVSNDRLIQADGIGAEALTQIAVQIYFVHTDCLLANDSQFYYIASPVPTFPIFIKTCKMCPVFCEFRLFSTNSFRSLSSHSVVYSLCAGKDGERVCETAHPPEQNCTAAVYVSSPLCSRRRFRVKRVQPSSWAARLLLPPESSIARSM